MCAAMYWVTIASDYACRLLGTNPLPVLMVNMSNKEQKSMQLQFKYYNIL